MLYVPGNHEFYSGEIDARVADGKDAAQGTNVTLLDREVAAVAGARFVGAILWTDYTLQENPERAMRSPQAGCPTTA